MIYVGFVYSRYQVYSEDKIESIVFHWSHSPKKISLDFPLSLMFTLQNEKGNIISKAHIDVEATMNHSGMIPINTTALYSPSKNVYETKLNLSMRGGWIVFLTITLENKQVIKKTISFTTE